MVAVKAYYNGHAFIPESPIRARVNQEAIITLIEPSLQNTSNRTRLLSMAGSLSNEDFLEIEKSLEETEKVDSNDW